MANRAIFVGALLSGALLLGCAKPDDLAQVSVKPPEPVSAPAVPVEQVAQTPSSAESPRIHPGATLATETVRLAGQPFRLWLMDTDSKRQEGMMWLKPNEVADDQGMIFIFPQVQPAVAAGGMPRGFWMQNTLVPLDIIFVADDGRVLNIGKGVPLSEVNVPTAGAFRYVIELKQGTAARLGLKPGTRLTLPKLEGF